MSKNKEIGNMGEQLACDYLTKNGYEIIERNKLYTRQSEIDIIAKRKNLIVFVEVKTRTTDSFGTPFEAVDKTKLQHLKSGIFQYVQENNVKKYQIDLIGITLKPELKIQHLRNISL